MSINDQNLAQLIRKQKMDQKENQQTINNAQDFALEERHIGENYTQIKDELRGIHKKKIKSVAKIRSEILYNKRERASSVTSQVNYDKCMYSKLITFERQESAFVQKFLTQFD